MTSGIYSHRVAKDLLTGERLLWRAFGESPSRNMGRGAPLLSAREPGVLLIERGLAYRSCLLPDGRQSILDILIMGDIAGLEHVVMAPRLDYETVAASQVSGRYLEPAKLEELLSDRSACVRLMALFAEAGRRMERLAATFGRFDARQRIAALLLDLYDRHRRRELISRTSFSLPLTQGQVADYLGLTFVHVNRTLRRLREEGLVIFDRRVVIIQDLDRLRGLVGGLPEWSETTLADPNDGQPAEGLRPFTG
jgi:CRP/FNR family transcriptional regulator